MPEPNTLPQDITKLWDDTLNELTDLVEARARSASPGIPGTAIESDEAAAAVQGYLDCMVSEGEWVYNSVKASEQGTLVHKQQAVFASCDKRFYKSSQASEEWHARQSLKWTWRPSVTECESRLPKSRPKPTRRMSRQRFCQLLAHKSILLVGDLTQYELHDLILDYSTTQPVSCYGSLYCSEHLLCGDILRKGIDDWSRDEIVYDRIPAFDANILEEREVELGQSSEAKMQKARSVSHGTLLRFARADGLRFAGPQTVSTWIHPYTGLAEPNHQWLNDAHRSDVVVLTKSPIAFPVRSRNIEWDGWWRSVKARSKRHERWIIEAARKVTEEVWLPELLETLHALRNDRAGTSPPDQLVIYRSRWRTHPDCASSFPSSILPASPGDGPPLRMSPPTLLQLLQIEGVSQVDKDDDDEALFSAFHNAQVVLQNHLARTIAPRFGIVYLDLETMLSVWRSGMVGSSETTAQFVNQQQQQQSHLRTAASGDCHRYCLPNPALEEAWLGSLQRLFELGWAGNPKWEGDGFTSVKQRQATS